MAGPSTDIDFDSLLALTVQAAPVGIVVVSQAGRIILLNTFAEKLFGYARSELNGKPVEMLLPQNYRVRHVRFRTRYMDRPSARQMGTTQDLFGRHKDGSEFPIEVGLNPVHRPEGLIVISTIIDISERKASERRAVENQVYRNVFAALTDASGVIQDGHYVLFNAKLAAMTGCTEDEIPTHAFTDFVMPEFVQMLKEKHAQRLTSSVEPPPLSEVRLLRRDGTPGAWVEINARRIALDNRPAVLVVLRDISARRASAVHLERLAMSDPLTGLANRLQFTECLEQELLGASPVGTNIAVFYLDVDGFKQINDVHGHAGGDAVLKCVAERLLHCVRKTDTVARLGGDEFGLIVMALDGSDGTTSIADKILREVSKPIRLATGTVQLGVSIGIALYPEHGSESGTLLEYADEALYRAKRAGKNTFRHWS
jgi:diguanylate cyclase (GGDEF)-like protein/PAS domain S-box-containing protein